MCVKGIELFRCSVAGDIEVEHSGRTGFCASVFSLMAEEGI